ncbi:MAG: HlyC/CorC family transporter [Acidimicrobiales bacterium]|nr:HlyC/CorC family transporter [Acidimicrobiales bacterium]MCB9372820.1 HlyC/CorC family transporter [Microthrixaceae bacterium]
MSGTVLLGALVVVALVVFAAVLAMAETALLHLGRARAAAIEEELAATEGDAPVEARRGGTLPELLERRDEVLNPVLLLLLVCHLGLATVTAVVAYDWWGLAGVAGALVVEIGVLFVVTEAMPKTYALQHTGPVAVRLAPLVGGLARFWPLRWATRGLIGMSNVLLPGKGRREGPSVSEEELLALAGAAAEEDVIELEEQALIESIIEFGDTIAREVMVPRTDMVTIAADFQIDAAIEVAILHGYSRLPAYGEGIDDITGIVYAKDLMRAERDDAGAQEVSTVLRPAVYIPETKRVPDLLRQMQEERFHIAIVIDEYGGTAGMVTLEDLIEELVGEIRDEFDVEEPMVEPLPNGGLRVNARLPIDEVNDLLRIEVPDGDWDTVGGFLYSQLGRVPSEGEAVEFSGYELRAERVQARRIGRVRITPVRGTDAAEPR